MNHIVGVLMVSVLAASGRSLGQTKEYKSGICCFSAKHAALRRKNKDWLAQNLSLNQDNASEWGDTSIRWQVGIKQQSLTHILHVINWFILRVCLSLLWFCVKCVLQRPVTWYLPWGTADFQIVWYMCNCSIHLYLSSGISAWFSYTNCSSLYPRW
jgi:hypothetical protein